MKISHIVFDWGDTIMRDFALPGPMSLWPEVAWIEGAEEFLLNASRLFNCTIATSALHSDVNEMKKALSRVGADKYFHHFFSRFELGYSKPDPMFFIQVLTFAGAAADETMMIGNLYDMDIVGAKTAGMTTVLLNENSEPGQYPAADFVIRHYTELNNILNL